MLLESLRHEVLRANQEISRRGLAPHTWGNASGIDRDSGLVVIKPSGVSYADMRPEQLVVVDLDGNTVEGTLRPSSDMKTHIALYRAWPEIGGVVHTHSTYATAFAQACLPIPCYGTTHADFCPGNVPCVRALTAAEVDEDYEACTGNAIIGDFKGLSPKEYPGAIVSHHGPFAWGKNAIDAANNGLILENVALMALLTRTLNPNIGPIPDHILQKHHSRKHGPNAYYGQK